MRYNPPPRPRYVYHRRYVTESMEPKATATVGSDKKSQRGNSVDSSLLERRVVPESNVAYTIPLFWNKMKDAKPPSEALGFVREILLQAVDFLVYLEEKDNAAAGGKNSHNYI
jgi:hypothetical protein